MILFVFLFACNSLQPEESAKIDSPYFDLPQLVEKQLSMLTASPAALRKKLEVNKKIEEIDLTTVDWEQELKLFEEANINKPVLRGAYAVTEEKIDGLEQTSYKSKEQDNKVQHLLVKKKAGQVVSVNVLWKDTNPIYVTQKQMTMELEEGKLSSYQIKGYQKMVADDTLFFKLDAVVRY